MDVALTPPQRRFAERGRRATLATIEPAGAPRPVPICFALGTEPTTRLYTPLDEKPKRVADPHRLARVRDLERDPRASVLIEHWSEDWAELGWLRLTGRVDIVEPDAGPYAAERGSAIAALRDRYPQYATQRLEDAPLLRFTIERIVDWGRVR